MNLIKNISFFTFFNLLNAAIPFLLLPILTVYLAPTDYAVIDIFNSLNMLFMPLVVLSIVGSISRFYFEEEVKLPIFIKTVFSSTVKYGVCFIALNILVTLLLFFSFDLKLDFPPYLLILSALFVFFSQLGEILLTLWRVSYKTSKYGVFRVSKTALDLGLSILLIVYFDFGWEGKVAPSIGVGAIYGIAAIIILSRTGFLGKSLRYNKGYNKMALAYSIPLIFHSVGGYIIAVSDRFFVLAIEGAEETGIYAVAYQIGMVMGLVQNSFNQAWVPYFYESLNKGTIRVKKRIVKITYFYFAGLILMVFIFSGATPLFYEYFIGDGFKSGMTIVFWVLLGYTFNGMYKMVVNYLFYLKKTKIVAQTTILVAAINLLLNYFLITANGIIGAAQATAISFLLLFIIILIKVLSMYKMPWTLKSDR